MNIITKDSFCIGIIAPSRHITDQKAILKQGILRLNQFNLSIKLGPRVYLRDGNSAGSINDRVADIHEQFSDPEIQAILCAMGGDSANQLLEHIDYNLIKNNPKPFIGYSDNTHLTLAIYQKTKIVTYHGPNLNRISSITNNSLKQLIQTITKQTNQNYFTEYQVVKPGKAKGKLLGGNLFVINALQKTDYCPNLDHAILFWEDIDEGLSAIEYQLYQMHLSGLFDRIDGMIIGHVESSRKFQDFSQIILKLTEKYSYPIIKTNTFGHNVKKFYTFPEGEILRINTQNKDIGWE